jgi:hypothetical protein
VRISFSIAALRAFVWCGHADAEYLTYSEWASLPSAARAYYISGLFDALTGVVNRPAEKSRSIIPTAFEIRTCAMFSYRKTCLFTPRNGQLPKVGASSAH